MLVDRRVKQKPRIIRTKPPHIRNVAWASSEMPCQVKHLPRTEARRSPVDFAGFYVWFYYLLGGFKHVFRDQLLTIITIILVGGLEHVLFPYYNIWDNPSH